MTYDRQGRGKFVTIYYPEGSATDPRAIAERLAAQFPVRVGFVTGAVNGNEFVWSDKLNVEMVNKALRAICEIPGARVEFNTRSAFDRF